MDSAKLAVLVLNLVMLVPAALLIFGAIYLAGSQALRALRNLRSTGRPTCDTPMC